MVIPSQVNKRLAHAALAACAGAFLILYIFNIYPSVAFSQEGDWLEISQVFDFQVPEEIIASGTETGVSNAISIDPGTVVPILEEEFPLTAEQNYLLDLADEVSTWDMGRRMAGGGGWSTNYYDIRVDGAGSALLSGRFAGGGLSPRAVDFAMSDDAEEYLWQGNDVPFFSTPDVSAVSSQLQSDALPEGNPFESANPLIQGYSPPPGWFLDHLPSGSLYDAIFAPWDSEIDSLARVNFLGATPFSYLPTVIDGICTNLEHLLSDSRVVPRRLLALPLALFNILLIFKWWLWRITRVWAIISGGKDPGLQQDSTEKE